MGKYRFHVGKTGIELGQQIDMPVASLVSSSGYSSSLPYFMTEEDASFFEALRFVSIGGFRKYVGTTSIDIIPSVEKRRKWPSIRISYTFSGMNYDVNDVSVQSVDHIILVGAIFRLFR